jgi:hypothetical protein
MIIKLPSKASRKYRGKYPKRINSHSYAKGTHHYELNDGTRYVARGVIFSPAALRATHIGQEIGDIVCNADREAYLNAPTMSMADYSAIVFLGRIFRQLRG